MVGGRMKLRAVVMGASAGGMVALATLLSCLPEHFSLPIAVVQHLSPNSGNYLVKYLDERCNLLVKEAEEKERLLAGCVYVAPPNYHLLVEDDETFSLTMDERVNFSRPAIDVLFETAAEVYRDGLVGVILTGANKDGSSGLKRIKELGGIALVQDPADAEVVEMPRAAIAATIADYILPLDKMGKILCELDGGAHERFE